jgi:NhaP-type Na+/H+ or K+/H+ antiporter
VALAVLLVEIDLEVISLQFWVGTLLSGAAVGLGIGFAGVALFRKLKRPKVKNWFFFGWAYLAYLIGLALGTSAIAVTMAAALVVAAYGFSIGLWLRESDIPLPSKTPLFFYLTAGVWILLGWQAHTTVDPSSLPGILAALVVITAGILVLRRVVPVSEGDGRWSDLFRKETGVLLLLFGGILFWPRQALLTTLSVEIALAAALLLIILLKELLKPLFDMLGVELSWPQ